MPLPSRPTRGTRWCTTRIRRFLCGCAICARRRRGAETLRRCSLDPLLTANEALADRGSKPRSRGAATRMKIATFNVNGINGRLPVLLRWLAEAQPDVACLQELKAAQEN